MSTTETAQAEQKWEYLQIDRKTEGYLLNELNQLGQEGWELVSVSFQKDVKSGIGAGFSWIAFLKRPYTGELQKRATTEKTRDVAVPPAQQAATAESDDTPEIFDFES